MWLIPGKTKVQTEIFKGVSLADILIGVVAGIIFISLLLSNLPYKFAIAVVLFFITALLLVRIDTEPNYIFLLHMLRHLVFPRRFERVYTDKYLLLKNLKGEREAGKELLQEEEDVQQVPIETKEERKRRIKAEKEERKADDKILKDKSVSKEEKDAIWLKRANQSAARSKANKKAKEENAAWKDMVDLFGVSDIKDGLIHYRGQYYGAAIEIPPVEFRFFSVYRKKNSIENGVGRILRSIGYNYAANIVKIERPILYQQYRENECKKLEELRNVYEQGMMTEQELQARVEVIYDRINELDSLCNESRVVVPFYYLVLFDSDKKQLKNQMRVAMDSLKQAELEPKRLNDKELAVFLKYTNQLDFDEHEIDKISPEDYATWILPNSVKTNIRTIEVNNIITHNMRVISFPMLASNSWLASMMSIPSTKVVVKCKPMDRTKAIRGIDRSLAELRAQYRSTGIDSKAIELQNHIRSLSGLLSMLQNDNEMLLNVNVYVTMYDIQSTRNSTKLTKQPPKSNRAVISNMKKQVRRMYQEQSMRMSNMDFEQLNMFIASQISGYDPFEKQGRGMPSNTISAAYPWVFAHVADKNGVKLGSSDGVPVFIDFFRRDSERVNSNMVIVGKSGSGKSYATKSLLTNLAADDAKIFILDPENEYTELAENLHGKFINVGNAQYGRLNPFHIITSLDDDEAGEQSSGSYATHLQFLEEFFKQIIPDCERDAMEYLNSLVDRMYTNCGITAETDLSKLRPQDYPIFDDLYDEILQEFQKTDNEYIRKMLRTLMNYIAKFSTGGRNANIWNGPSTITTDENFTVFNFQSLLANRNGTIANAQMLLVLKYIDNEIIKNREYNMKNNMSRKIVVVIDEAHVFIDEKYPVALDFMFQLAKRIRKYNGMQIVITQNIKDFVGTEEIARKSTAIINACQYSFIFSLAPNDMDDLCKLYEKAGGINEQEQEQIVSAPRGQAFTVMGPSSRTTFKVEVPEDVVEMFQARGFTSRYFVGKKGAQYWEDFIGDSRERHDEIVQLRKASEEQAVQENAERRFVNFQEVTEDEAISQLQEAIEKKAKKSYVSVTLPTEEKSLATEIRDDMWDDLPEILDIPEDPAEFEALLNAQNEAMEEAFIDEDAMDEQSIEEPSVEEVSPVSVPQMIETPVIHVAPQVVNKTEQMLAEFIGNFSYDVILQEIKRTVREELIREMESNGVLLTSGAVNTVSQTNEAGQQPVDVPKQEVMQENIFKEDGDTFADLFGSTDTTSSEPVEVKEDIFASIFGSADATSSETVEDEEDIFADLFASATSKSSEPMEDEEEDIFAALFGDDAKDNDDSFEEQDDEEFNIFEFFEEQDDLDEKISIIEKMEIYGDLIIDVTLEDLALYNKNMIQRG